MQVVEEKPLAKIYDAGLVRWVWQFIRPYQGLFWLATFLMPLDTAFLLAQPYVIKLTVDEFLSGAHGAPPPAWLALLFRASGGHGLFVMGALYLLLVICEFARVLRAILFDDDGRAVQPLRPSDGVVPQGRASADVVLRSHAGRQAGQPNDDRHRFDQRHVLGRFADDFHRRDDAAGHRDDHVLVESAAGDSGPLRDSAADAA